MPPLGEKTTDESGSPDASQTLEQGSRHPPLVIVSEQGRHSQAARRIVRAQAARASAAQSRVTRARNREEREGGVRESLQSPVGNVPVEEIPSSEQSERQPGNAFLQKPLAVWLINVLNVSANQLTEGAVNFTTAVRLPVADVTKPLGQAGTIGLQMSANVAESTPANETVNRQLPMALPRGFVALQQRLPVSDGLIGLLTRTACVDFASPGVERRLHQLLFDLVIFSGVSTLSLQPKIPIQGHLRIACTCLTIFQGQRANGQLFAHDNKYQFGLEAAWSEATMLDKEALAEPKSAEASLWALFIISVTTGAAVHFFRQQLQNLLHDLQLSYWEQVRKVLLDFIYPVSFLDEPCKTFYQRVRDIPMGFD